ncbi:MAG: DUF1570 domain-containing protein [Gemmatimonadales bacterium]|nr:MAG: DUF1570 domain-containing protein [Gemmatimonadales bacterium]
MHLAMRRVTTAILLVGLALPCWCEDQASGRRVMDSPEDNPALAAAQDLCAQHVPSLKALHEWQGDYGLGLEIVTAHYRIFTTFLEFEFLKRLPHFMESAHSAYNGLAAETVAPRAQSEVYLFADRRQWEVFTHAFAGDQAEVLCKIQQGAYCHKGACVAYNIGTDRTFAALAHEGWHQFMTRHFAYRLPSWLDEGLAMRFESFTWDKGECRFQGVENVYRVDGLRFQLTQGHVLSLRQLLASSPGEMMTQDNSHSVIGFYSQAYALTQFLTEGQRGHYRKRFARLLGDGLQAHWPLDAASSNVAADRNKPRTLDWNRKVGVDLFTHYIDADLPRIEAQYLAFFREMVQATEIGSGRLQ